MLRILRSECAGTTVLALEGKLFEPWLDEVRRALSSAGGEEVVELDLSRLEFADSKGALLLATLSRRGVPLRAVSPLIEGLMGASAQEPDPF